MSESPQPVTDIQAIMDADPHSLSRSDIDALIEHYRKARAAFNAKALKAPKEPKAPAPGKTPKTVIPLGDILSLIPKG